MVGEAGRSEVAELLQAEQDAIRNRLDGELCEPETLPAARAAASKLPVI
jgi:hypothetical protein